MRRPSLSIARMMQGIVALAVGLAALRYATPLWDGLLLCLSMGLLLAAPAGVLYRRGRCRAGWLGFGVFGGAAALTGLGPGWTDVGDRLPGPRLLAAFSETGPSEQEVRTIQGEIALARASLKRAEARREWSDRMLESGYVTEAANQGDELEVQRAEFNLEQAEKKLMVLRTSTGGFTFEGLRRWWSRVTRSGSPETRRDISHCLSTLAAGLVGTAVFRRFHATEGRVAMAADGGVPGDGGTAARPVE